jgi:predicted lipoprotein
MNHESPHKPRLLLWAGVLLGVAAYLYFLPPFHIVPLEEARNRSAEAAFDPDAFVEKFWNEQLTPSADSAVDAGALFAALAQDPAAAAERYGRRLGLSGKSSYLVCGSGRITAVGEGEVEIALPEGGAIVIDTGPVFGNTIRDGSGLLDVNDFANSQDFNAISAEINRRVEERVLPNLREEAAVDKTVRFLGAVEIADSVSKVESLKLVPVAIEIL